MDRVVPYRAKSRTIARFTQSDCYLLAPELAKRTGWDIATLTSHPVELESEYPGYMGHAFCISPCRKYALDIHGVTTIEEMNKKWEPEDCKHLYVFESKADSERELGKWHGSWSHKGMEPTVRVAQRMMRRISEGLEALV